jgi:hypothetical protein
MDSSITGVSQALSDLEFRPLTWENTVSEDRHNPLPHITLLTTGLKSPCGNRTVLSTRTTAELRELLVRCGRE